MRFLSITCCILLMLPTSGLADVDLVKVDKSKRRIYLLEQGKVIREYRIALGQSPKGHKQQEGDQRTPEGEYSLDFILEDSSFYRSMHISYPNAQDLHFAQLRGINPGGDIKIHGIKNGDNRDPAFIQSFDWTNGCIALTNQEMDEFLNLVKPGTPITIEW
ncbi:MAG: L,D-transpeptidase family protein [Vibrio sp.]